MAEEEEVAWETEEVRVHNGEKVEQGVKEDDELEEEVDKTGGRQ